MNRFLILVSAACILVGCGKDAPAPEQAQQDYSDRMEGSVNQPASGAANPEATAELEKTGEY
jgi:hypothetical protein